MKIINLVDYPDLLDHFFGHFDEYEVEEASVGGCKIGRITINKTIDFLSTKIGKKYLFKLEASDENN